MEEAWDVVKLCVIGSRKDKWEGWTGGSEIQYGVGAAVTGPEEGFVIWVWLWRPVYFLSVWMIFFQAGFD
jgi:hypothetical protein